MFDKVRIGAYHAAAWSARLVLLALVAITPWVYGGQFWGTQVSLIYGGALLTALTWLAACLSPRRMGACTPLTYTMLGFMLVLTAQLMPLPEWLAARFSAAQSFVREVNRETETTPAAQSDQPSAAEQAIWQDATRHRTLSILPTQTRASLAVYAVAVVAVWSASLLFVSKRWAIALAITLAISGLLNAFLGLIQVVSWNDWTLLPGMREISFSTFISRNSAPDFFATATGALFSLLGIAFRKQRHKRRKEYRVTYPADTWEGRLRNRMEDIFIDLDTLAVMCICGAAFMLVATLATLSRGGAIATLGAAAITMCFAIGARGGIARATTISAMLTLMVIGVLVFFGLDSAVLARMDELNEAAYTGGEGRFVVWKYTLASLQWYWLGGSGFGTYHFAILPFHTEGPDVWFYHAENLFLEIASETGVIGIALTLLALWLVTKKILQQSGQRKENLLLLAATFSTCTIFLHAMVDFRLILPGVFLPYGAVIGAFMGRCRRIESEHAYRRLMGEKHAHDARLRARAPTVERMRGRWLSHSIVAAASLTCMFTGLNSARGFAAAERLVKHLEVAEASFEAGEEVDWRSLSALLQETSLRHAGHPEAELAAGRVELLLWQRQAASAVDWQAAFDSTEEPNSQQLRGVSNPQVMAGWMRSPNKSDEQKRRAIAEDRRGMELARRSFTRFEAALAACPLDERALWGVLMTDAKWLSPHSRAAARKMLWRLAGNNTKMLMKGGFTAIQEGNRADGLKLMKQAVKLDRQRLFDFLRALLGYISADDLMEIAPDDTVYLASICRAAIQVASQDVPLRPLGDVLVNRVIQERLQPDQLAVAAPTTPEGWADLAWVAQRLGEKELRVALLRKAVSQARDRHLLRFELAQAEYDAGMLEAALKDLEQCIKIAPDPEQYRPLMAKWSESLDQKQ